MMGLHFIQVNFIIFSGFLLCLFMMYNASISRVNFLQLVDELLLLTSLIVITIHAVKQLQNLKFVGLYLSFLFYLVAGSINYMTSPFSNSYFYLSAQLLINIKIFVITLGVLLLYKQEIKYQKMVSYIWTFMLVLFTLGLILNWMLGSIWNKHFGEDLMYRLGWLRPIGWFGSTGHVGYYFVITFVTWYMLNSKKKIISSTKLAKDFIVVAIVTFLVSYPLSVRKTMFMSLPFCLFVLSRLPKHKSMLFGFLVIVSLGVFSFFVKDTNLVAMTQENFSKFAHDDHGYIRGLMFFYGLSMFWEYFPLGLGSATFGTVLSTYNTLSVYEFVGLSVDGIHDGVNLDGIYDSGIASFLAENGFIGSLFAFAFIYYFVRFNKSMLDSYSYEIFKILTLFTIIVSLIGPAWQNGLYTVFYVINVLLIYTRNNQYKEGGKWKE